MEWRLGFRIIRMDSDRMDCMRNENGCDFFKRESHSPIGDYFKGISTPKQDYKSKHQKCILIQ